MQIKLLLLLLKGQCSCCCYSVRVTVAAVQCNQPWCNRSPLVLVMLEYIFMQMTKWSGRKASAKCVQTAPDAYISLLWNWKRTTAGTTPENNKKTNFPPVSRLCLLFGEIQSSIFRFSLTTSFWGIAKRCCAVLVVISHPSKGGFEFLLKVHFFR